MHAQIMRLIGAVLVCSFAALAGGCGEGAATTVAPFAAPAEQPAPAAPRFLVIGVDRSESFDRLTRTALGLAEQHLRKARPADEMVVRWISDRSYRSDEVFLHVRLPDLPTVAENPFNAKQRAVVAEAKRRFQGEASKALNVIQAQHPEGGTPSTDIFGFIAAAAEHLAVAPAGYERQLIIASDMEDNRRYDVVPDLSGVAVRIHLIVIAEQPDPSRIASLKTVWEGYFKKAGAASVTFEPADSNK